MRSIAFADEWFVIKGSSFVVHYRYNTLHNNEEATEKAPSDNINKSIFSAPAAGFIYVHVKEKILTRKNEKWKRMFYSG